MTITIIANTATTTITTMTPPAIAPALPDDPPTVAPNREQSYKNILNSRCKAMKTSIKDDDLFMLCVICI